MATSNKVKPKKLFLVLHSNNLVRVEENLKQLKIVLDIFCLRRYNTHNKNFAEVVYIKHHNSIMKMSVKILPSAPVSLREVERIHE